MSLFYFFGGDGTDRAGQGGGYMPRRWRPKPPAHLERPHTTGSNTGRARRKADHATHRHTRQKAEYAAPEDQDGGAGGRGACPANYTFSDAKYFPCKRV